MSTPLNHDEQVNTIHTQPARFLTVSVRNSTGAWEVIEREHASVSSQAVGDITVDAMDIGGASGQELLVELRDENDQVLDAVELFAS